MASEQQPGAQPSPDNTYRTVRLADHAASAALYATRLDRKSLTQDPIVTEVRVINPKETGSGANLSHASAGAALAHAMSRHYKGGKRKQEATGRTISDAQDSDAAVASQVSMEGGSAASVALRGHRPVASRSTNTQFPSCYPLGDGSLEDAHRDIGHARAVRAATGAITNGIKRTGEIRSTTSEPPGAAIVAAGTTHRASFAEPGSAESAVAWNEANRINQVAHANVQLYGSRPSAAIDIGESDKKTVARAAAVSMSQDGVTGSKDERVIDVSLHNARTTPGRLRSQGYITASDPAALQRAITLQYAAERLATERLAGMKDEDADFQRYYGTEPQPQQLRPRLSVRRKRPPSTRETSRVDMERSMAIRDQMSSLQTKLNAVDEQRQKDRDRLMDAARKNVNAVLQDMELKVFVETGRRPPSIPRDTERTLSDTEFEYVDRVNIGLGQFINEGDLEAAALANVRSDLHEMDDRVLEERAKEIEERLDREEEKRHKAVEREREADLRAEEKRGREKEKKKKKEKPRKEKPRKEKKRSAVQPAVDKFNKRVEDRLRASEEHLRESRASLDELDEEYRAKEISSRLDNEQQRRHEAIEREREAETREAEKEILADKRKEEEQRVSKRESDRVREREPSAEPEESMRAEKREPPVERATTPAAATTTTETEPEAQAEPQVEPQAEEAQPEAQPEPRAEPEPEPEREIPVEPSTEPSVEPSSSREGILPEMTRSQTAEGQNGAVASGAATGTGPATIPTRRESRFRTWFRDRLGRGRPGDSPAGPLTESDAPAAVEGKGGNAPKFTGGSALAPTEDARGAALRSHPVITGVDLAQMQNGGANGETDHGPSNSAEDRTRQLSEREKPLPNGDSRRSRFRDSLIRIVSGNSPEPRTNGFATHSEDTPMHSAAEEQSGHGENGHGENGHAAAAEREDLRENAAEQGLPAPPALGEQWSHSTARESRFSEDI